MIKVYITGLLLLVCLLLNLLAVVHSTYQIEELLERKNYDVHVRPHEKTNHPVNITLQLVPTTLGPINERHLTFTIIFLQRLQWNDERLKWTPNNSYGMLQDITFSDYPSAHIWIPDIYVANAKEYARLSDFSRTVVKSNGDVYFSSKIITTCTCNMDIRKFPFDEQTCYIQLESYAFNDKQMGLYWSDQDIVIPSSDKITLPGYELLGISTSRESFEYGGPEHRFDNVYLVLKFKRNTIYYVYKAFIPTILLSIFNIGSYWIPDNAMPARVTLIITTFLASTLILQSVTDQTIAVPYTTSMQLFLMVNVMFLLLSIFQYLLLLFLKGRAADIKTRRQKDSSHDYHPIFSNITLASKDKNRAAPTSTNRMRINKGAPDNNNNNSNGSSSSRGLDNFKAVVELAVQKQQQGIVDENMTKVHYLDQIFRYVVVLFYSSFCIFYFGYYAG